MSWIIEWSDMSLSLRQEDGGGLIFFQSSVLSYGFLNAGACTFYCLPMKLSHCNSKTVKITRIKMPIVLSSTCKQIGFKVLPEMSL